eukprot:50845_1
MTTRNPATKKRRSHKREHSFEWFATTLAQSLCNGSDEVKIRHIVSKIEEQGILQNDPRLTELRHLMHNEETVTKTQLIEKVIPKNLEMFTKIFKQKLTISNFSHFKQQMQSIYDETKQNDKGKVADYIPQLAKSDPSQFGVSICTVDGQQLHLGEADNDFSIQSCCKVFNYCIAVDEHGPDVVHKYVGKEPSGKEFNAITLDKNRLPHNPCTNAGAIMICSMIGKSTEDIDILSDHDDFSDTTDDDTKVSPPLSTQSTSRNLFMKHVLHLRQSSTMPTMQQVSFEADRFELLNTIWKQLFGGTKIGFSNSVYLSEKSTGHRNYALGHFMYEQSPGFPPNTDLKGVLEFYFQNCSLEATTKKLSIAAATLANGGVNPLTGQQVFSPETVRNCLSIMTFCGMYDYSGEFAFKIGIPSKSGVSGAIVSVVPNVMGICTFSPLLDSYGNSVRGVEFLSKLSQQFAFHHFDNMKLKGGVISSRKSWQGAHDKRLSSRCGQDLMAVLPLNNGGSEMTKFQVLSYSASGDLNALKRMYFSGCELNVSDYDLRTPLHLASSCGHLEIVKFLLEITEDVDVSAIKDRWGGTPFDDAIREKHQHIVQYFHSKGIVPLPDEKGKKDTTTN